MSDTRLGAIGIPRSWAEADRQPDGYHYTQQALDTFPRYNILNAIRIDLERMNPTTLADVETTRSLLVVAGETATDEFTQEAISEIDARATAQEREGFCGYVRRLQPSDLDAVEPLPLRRVLRADESKSIWSRLRSRSEIANGYWSLDAGSLGHLSKCG